jgi:hypothetical protein
MSTGRSWTKIIAATEGSEEVLMSDISSADLEYWLPKVADDDRELYYAIRDELAFRKS